MHIGLSTSEALVSWLLEVNMTSATSAHLTFSPHFLYLSRFCFQFHRKTLDICFIQNYSDFSTLIFLDKILRKLLACAKILYACHMYHKCHCIVYVCTCIRIGDVISEKA